MPHNPRTIANQGDTSACTGFALATTIEYLLDRAERPVERISGHMLYSMARRYDEWADNDNEDEGSSLRGALEGMVATWRECAQDLDATRRCRRRRTTPTTGGSIRCAARSARTTA